MNLARSFPYGPLAMLVLALPALVSHYALGERFLLSVGSAWALISAAALIMGVRSLLEAYAFKHAATLQIRHNRVSLNGREAGRDFSSAGAVIADMGALGEAIDEAISCQPGFLARRLKTVAEVHVFTRESTFTPLERLALNRVLEERFVGHCVTEEWEP